MVTIILSPTFYIFGKSIIKYFTYNYYPKIFHLFSHPDWFFVTK